MQVHTGADHGNVTENEIVELTILESHGVLYNLRDHGRAVLALPGASGATLTRVRIQKREIQHLSEVVIPDMHRKKGFSEALARKGSQVGNAVFQFLRQSLGPFVQMLR